MENQFEVYEVEQGEQFKKDVKMYVRKKQYRHLPGQVLKLMENLKQGIFDSSTTPPLLHSELPTPYDVYKMRMPNPDAGEGKSGGYRVIYMVKTANKIIVLMTVYSKSEKENITDHEIELLLEGYFMSQLPEED